MSVWKVRAALLQGRAAAQCRAVVVIPARNEESTIEATCDAFAAQVDTSGERLSSDSFELILLLNNCTDRSAELARAWSARHPEVCLHVCECAFEANEAHVGNARSLLMDTAWLRLAGTQRKVCGILTTDADTVVAADWVAQNMAALEAGADVVGGVIDMDDSTLPETVRVAYRLDRAYQALVAELEHRLDPQEGDPWPRHLEHFGGSLACTPEIYARAGGMPAVTPLEDLAFIDALRRVDAKIRHEPKVRVKTSARMQGRVQVGLSGQLRQWDTEQEQRVTSASYLQHRFARLRQLREFWRGGHAGLVSWCGELRLLEDARASAPTCGEFLGEVDCNRLIDRRFDGEREEPIEKAVADLRVLLSARSG